MCSRGTEIFVHGGTIDGDKYVGAKNQIFCHQVADFWSFFHLPGGGGGSGSRASDWGKCPYECGLYSAVAPKIVPNVNSHYFYKYYSITV